MNINNLIWKVTYDKEISENYMGETNYFKLEIKINPTVENQSNLERTVMHEVIHAYLYSFGFTNKEQFQLEDMIEFMSHNFENIKWLTQIALKELKGVKE